ncbi:hypothetical protein IP88_00845 [alpha proteobacterium AAP81b]|nr:hypothetical protein IP88_00845 [alpha proteobacterium AAP81b]
MTDTIVALASGRPPAAIAVVRVSGPGAHAALAALAGADLPPPRYAVLRRLTDPRDGSRLDDALVLRFAAPASATGEDVAELHLHGGSAVVAGVIAALTVQPGVRLARPGEFTRRSFASGRLDLAQVEGLADLIAAETAAQRGQALALAGGALSRVAESWRERCLDILAEAEAALDFAEDESDVAARLAQATQASLAGMADALDALLADAGRAARLRDGLTIVVSGPPNVGKSSLVNALARRDAAIVTPLPGTTRDAIEVPIDLDGVAAVLVDTAGLRDTDDPIEAQGIRRARARAADADLVLVVSDAAPPVSTDNVASLTVITKHDLGTVAPPTAVHVSALSGHGMAELRDRLARWAAQAVRPGEAALLGHTRHREAFSIAATTLRGAAATDDDVLRAEQLRAAAHAFGSISGRVGVEDVLDRIFARFCIGK